jgi:hypothetical protein
MFVTADQLFAHAIGDYLLQNDWMAQAKTRWLIPALAHAFVYSAPFVFLCGAEMPAFAVIFATHAIIDRWSLGRKLKPMPATAPESLRIWLPIICDNLLHIGINAAALKWL